MRLLLGSEEHTSELQSPCNLVCGFFLDRKSTRLNSSHLVISYAVFCLKKKNSIDSVATAKLRSLSTLKSITGSFWRNSQTTSFFFNDTATTEISTLSLHDALPIYLTRDAVASALGRAMVFRQDICDQ